MKYLKYYISTITLIIAFHVCFLGEYFPTVFFCCFSLFIILGDLIVNEDSAEQNYSKPYLLDFPMYLNFPLLLSALVLIFFDSPITAFIFLGLIGMSNGLANVLGSSTWAEIYGVKHIGSIKALTTALMVFSTAFGTALFGFLIDKGYSIEEISLVSFVYIFASIILLFFVRNKLNPKYI